MVAQENRQFVFLERDWIVRVERPANPEGAQLLVLLHGWTGDENVTSVFTRRFPPHYWILAPRGPVATKDGGYGWIHVTKDPERDYDEMVAMAEKLHEMIGFWLDYLGLPPQPASLIGFSQGASLSLTYTLRFPQEVGKVAALSGGLPEWAAKLVQPGSLAGKRIFIAHGTKDTVVPIEHSQRAAQLIRQDGGEPIFCQSDVGHKVASPCFKQMETYFNGQRARSPLLAGTEQGKDPEQQPDSGDHNDH
jgi:phospholipase/carboxylesterase